MAELLASLRDVNRWLPSDKLVATDSNTAEFQVEALQLIRGQLANSFPPVTIAEWINPAATPDTIRSIAGRLIAAFLYKEVYSEDTANLPQYAVDLYSEAIATLAGIRAGTVVVIGTNGQPISNTLSLDSNHFFPNASADGPYFTMSQRFG